MVRIPRTHVALTPILASVPLQLLAYHIAVLRGAIVDQPRNLAKSLTVESGGESSFVCPAAASAIQRTNGPNSLDQRVLVRSFSLSPLRNPIIRIVGGRCPRRQGANRRLVYVHECVR